MSENEGVDNFYKWAQYWKFRMDPNGRIGGGNQILAREIREGFEPLCEIETDVDEGIEWRNLGPFNSDNTFGASNNCGGQLLTQNQGRLDAISVHPDDPNRILVGGANGGIWKTVDGGGSWRNVTVEEGFTIVGMRDIVRHPVNPDIVYAATGGSIPLWDLQRTFAHNYGIGVIRSLDDGETWHLMPYRSNTYSESNKVISLAIDPSSTLESTTIYGHGGSGWMLSFNDAAAGEEPWDFLFNNQTCISAGLRTFNEINDVEVGNDGTVLFSARNGSNQGDNYHVYRFEPGTNICPVQLPHFIAPAEVFNDPQFANCNTSDPQIRTIDIELVDPIFPNTQNEIVVMVSYFEFRPSNNNPCGGGNFFPVFFTWNDNDSNWNGGAAPLKVPLGTQDSLFLTTAFTRTFAVSRYNPNVLYVSNSDNCIHKSTDGGLTFSAMNSVQNHVDLRFIHVYDGDMTGDPDGLNDEVYIGTDGGISQMMINANGEVEWIDITGEGMGCTNNFGLGITEQNSDLIFTGAQDGSINFYNEGEWFQTRPGGDNGDALIKIDGTTIRVFQESQERFHRGVLNGVGTDVNGPSQRLPEFTRWAPLIHNSDKSEMFAATHGLYTSANDGVTWTPVATGAQIINELGLGTGDPIRLGNLGMSAGDDDVIYFCLSSFYSNASQPVSLTGGNVGGMFKATRTAQGWEIDLLDLDLDLGAPISDIAVDPDNSDIVWITLGSFVEGLKVMKSPDGGETWENHSGCLPNIPFSSIICQGGGSNQVYVGSDFGMYYKDDNLLNEEDESDWIFYADGPRALISDMEINRCANKIVVATMGLGLWEVDLVKEAPTVISSEMAVWNSEREVRGDLIIEDGATLRIFGTTISFSRLSNIIVKPGGTLRIIGSTLTNGCGDLWEGIDVWGDASQHQFAQDQDEDYLQGRVVIKNLGIIRSVIEYARTAVKLGRDDDVENLFTGGIINATNSDFLNNQTGIRFNPYTNTIPVPNAPVFANASTITGCNFLTNEPLPEGLNPIAFISLWGVDRIPIFNSTFINLSPGANTAAALGKGIYSQDASFKVSGSENGTSFTNLSHGVHAQSGKTIRKFIVDGVTFENCNHGVYFTTVNFTQITRSVFNFGFAPNEGAQTFGIVNQGSTGFQIEDNIFSSVLEANTNLVGTLMIQTGKDNNQIYRNRFTDLNIANWAIGENAAKNFSDGASTGLLYQCNDQINSQDHDINVLYGTGIRALQGSFDPLTQNFLPARNRFSNSGNNTWSDIAVTSGGANNINYVFGPGASEEPVFVTAGKVETNFSGVDGTGGCQSSFENPDDKEIKILKYNEAHQKYTARKQEYDQKIDNGNTAYFLNRLAVVGTNNQNLKNQLLAASPYISTKVMEKIVETGKFTQSRLFSILNANPDAVKQSGLLAVSAVQSNLSSSHLQQLEQNAGTLTERGEMELLLTSLKSEKDQYGKELIRLTLEEEERNSEANQEITSWLEKTESLAAIYAIIDLLFETGANTAGQDLLAKVPQFFNLNTEENLEYQDLNTLYELLSKADADERNEAYFSETEYQTADQLATDGHGKAKLRARNIMEFFYGKIYPLELPEQANLNDAPQGTGLVEAQGSVTADEVPSLVTVSPNPASTNVNIRYAAPSLYGNKGEIIVIDFYGKVLWQEKIDAQEKNISLTVTDWPSGMYYCIYKSTEKKRQLIPFFINH